MYKSLLPLNEENIFEKVFLVVVNMNNGTKKVVNMIILHNNLLYIFREQRYKSLLLLNE